MNEREITTLKEKFKFSPVYSQFSRMSEVGNQNMAENFTDIIRDYL